MKSSLTWWVLKRTQWGVGLAFDGRGRGHSRQGNREGAQAAGCLSLPLPLHLAHACTHRRG
jgi:hypothetical protein